MNSEGVQPLTEPEFESFTIELVPDTEDGAELERRARNALLDALGDAANEWEVSPVDAAEPGAFDLVPPAVGALPVGEAWQVAYALQASPGVVDAEPSFEILQDNVERTPAALAEAEEELFDALAAAGPPEVGESDFEWSPKLIRAPQAWQVVPPPGGKSRGEGIVIGHPDSGYRQHPQIFDSQPSRFLAAKGFDFVDRDSISEDEDGGHGLGTASVIMSRDDAGAHFVTGVAPSAQIVPYRVAKKRPIVPVPVLFASGMRRLRDAVNAAVALPCHVISISLGWLPNRSLHKAIQRASQANVIIVAAAGNHVPFVVWPAAYSQVIAVAGCTSRRRTWVGSSFGPRVAVSAPARNVWKAAREGTEAVVTTSNGTSFAAASTAGLAALWLAHWGRDALLTKYGGEFRLSTVFRKLLIESADPPPIGGRGLFGAGIVNAEKLLSKPLPGLEALRQSSEFAFEAAALSGDEPTATAGFNAVAEAFDNVPRPALRAEIGRLIGAEEDDLDRSLHGVGRELAFHLLTNPVLREALVARAAPDIAPIPALAGVATVTDITAASVDLHETIAASSLLSRRLRSRLAG